MPPKSEVPPTLREYIPAAKKPFKCETPGCSKAFLNKNGLKYHRLHGKCKQTDFDVDDPDSPDIGKAAQYPYRCFAVESCGKTYKALNGLRYHYLHSGSHGLEGYQMLQDNCHPPFLSEKGVKLSYSEESTPELSSAGPPASSSRNTAPPPVTSSWRQGRTSTRKRTVRTASTMGLDSVSNPLLDAVNMASDAQMSPPTAPATIAPNSARAPGYYPTPAYCSYNHPNGTASAKLGQSAEASTSSIYQPTFGARSHRFTPYSSTAKYYYPSPPTPVLPRNRRQSM